MFAEGIIDLVQAGVITGSRKRPHPGLIVSSFVMGTRRLYDFIDNNPMVPLYASHYTNDLRVIAEHEEMVAINSAIEVDLTRADLRRFHRSAVLQWHRWPAGLHPRRRTCTRRAAHHRPPGHGPEWN